MSNLKWYPGAALPPSAEYPWRATNSGRFNKYGSTSCASIQSRYAKYGPLFAHEAGNSSCAGVTPAYWGDKNFYSPTVSSRDQLPLGTGPHACAPVHGCLDPAAVSYDKLALTHCQGMCAYKKPKVCMAGGYEMPRETSCNACPDAPLDEHVNPIAQIYRDARSGQSGTAPAQRSPLISA